MNFLFNVWNHDPTGRRTLDDVLTIIAHQLRALGHQAAVSNKGFIHARSGINVIVEGFHLEHREETIDLIADAHGKGSRFIIIATEEPVEGKGFNAGVRPGMKGRQIAFPEAAKYADAILALVPETETWYRQFAPTEHIELGWARTLERPPNHHLIKAGFGFFGSSTKRRRDIIRRLVKRTRNSVRVMETLEDQPTRDAAMQEAQVLIQIRPHDAASMVSSSRCNTCLHLGRPVLAEPHKLEAPWNKVIDFSPSIDQFYADALPYLLAWQQIYGEQMKQFRDVMSPAECIGKPLDRLGIVPMRAAA